MAARNLLFTLAGNVHTNTLASQFYNFNSGTLSGITKLTAGGFALGYVGKTATYTIQDGDYTINCTTGTFTVTLPTAVGRSGQVYFIKNSGAGTITVATTSAQTIDGDSSVALIGTQGITVQSTGAHWIVIAYTGAQATFFGLSLIRLAAPVSSGLISSDGTEAVALADTDAITQNIAFDQINNASDFLEGVQNATLPVSQSVLAVDNSGFIYFFDGASVATHITGGTPGVTSGAVSPVLSGESINGVLIAFA